MTTLSDYTRVFEEVAGQNTRALTYSRWERLVFRFTGHWPERVVDRRMEAIHRDEIALRRALDSLGSAT